MAQRINEVYSSTATEISHQQLETVTTLIEPPACLLGGWAVHLWVTEPYEESVGHGYIGSRDIDLGFPLNPDHTPEQLKQGNLGTTFAKLQNNGFSPSTFGFQKFFNTMNKEELTEDQARDLPAHQLVEMRVDIQPDTPDSQAFREAFGFQPPAEPLLTEAFNNAGQPLSRFVDWELPDDIRIVDYTLLAAMKTRSFPGRTKRHKKVKDLADLYTLIWYVDTWKQTIQKALDFLEPSDRQRFAQELDDSLIEDAAVLIDGDTQTMQQVYDQLVGP